jgi:hypothetical protein
MLKQTMIAAATTLVLVTGALSVSTGSALAGHRGETHRGQYHDRGWDSGPRGHHGWGRGHKVCRPVVRERKVWRHHRWQWRKVVVGERCHWVRGNRGHRW